MASLTRLGPHHPGPENYSPTQGRVTNLGPGHGGPGARSWPTRGQDNLIVPHVWHKCYQTVGFSYVQSLAHCFIYFLSSFNPTVCPIMFKPLIVGIRHARVRDGVLCSHLNLILPHVWYYCYQVLGFQPALLRVSRSSLKMLSVHPRKPYENPNPL